MTADQLMECRDAFEKWCDETGRNTRRGRVSGGYVTDAMQAIWQGWQAAWNTRPKGGEAVADRLSALISEYWQLAYAEGKEGRTEDTPEGDAQRCWHSIQQLLQQVTHPPRSVDEAERTVKENLTVSDEARDVARLDFVAQQSYSMRKRGDGRSNAFLWDENFPIEGVGVEANMRACIDEAMAARGGE